MNNYVNYHKHCNYSNIVSRDSSIKPEAYIKRALELNHNMVFSTQHGVKDGEYEYYKLCKQNNLKFGFGVEAYWVKDRKINDNTNNHIILLATNEKSRKSIIKSLSEANKTGYYYKPRIDYEILQELSEDVFVTTACLGFNGYGFEESENAIIMLRNKFKKNFYLEVQNHHTEKQVEWNKFILKMSKKYNIPIIAGMDSHYIYENQKNERTAYLESKGIYYENEEGWFMDYPTYDIAYNRFKKQDVLSEKEIKESLQNTLKLLEFEDINFDNDIKLPSIYKDLTQEEKDKKLISIIKTNLTKNEKKYTDALNEEFKVIKDTKFSDYFLFNYEMIKKGIEFGGKITLTSRGSAPSFYINNLLSFTTIDRVNSPILMYPERFATADRILKSRSLFDIDFNVADPKPFIKAQKELLGDDNSYYMVAYGKLKEKSAWKMYAKVNNIEFDTANKISKQIESFELDYKHAEEEDKEYLNIYDYIEKQYHKIYDESKIYQGIIDSISPSPCSHLLLDKPISEEVGILKIKEEYCACIDGVTAESFGYMKNDLLTVTIVDIIYRVYDKIGIKPHTLPELIDVTYNNNLTWEIYEKGLTMCINQCERDSTKSKVMKFKPKNIAELSDFVAVIRPGASSIVNEFLNREYFEYGIKEVDDLIQTKYKPSSYILYQEEVMKLLAYAGFEASETYTILKGIAKKKPEVVDKAKNKFYDGFLSKGYEKSNIDKFWHVMELNASYSFNASHSLSVAGDSLYGAYLKANYPYEFYEVVLNLYSEKKDNEKVAKLKEEMRIGFGIEVGELKYGNDNRQFISDKNNKKINQSLLSCKNTNTETGNFLYELGKLNLKSFLEILVNIKNNKNIINKTKLETLIKIGYFKQFGKVKKLLQFVEYYDKLNKTNFSKDNTDEFILNIIKPYCEDKPKTLVLKDKEKALQDLWDKIPNQNLDLITQIQNELDLLGYIQSDIPDGIYLFDVKWSGKSKNGNEGAWLISKRNNNEGWFKFKKGLNLPPKESIIITNDVKVTEFEDRKNYIIQSYNIIKE